MPKPVGQAIKKLFCKPITQTAVVKIVNSIELTTQMKYKFSMIYNHFKSCIDACLECVAICNQCAVACLNEKDTEHLKRCIELDLDCATVCRSTVELMSRSSSFADSYCRLCADVCAACAEECERHAAMHDHCRLCAEACRRCADACMAMA